MGMGEYGCFMQLMFIISEIIVNIEQEDQTCFIGHICFSKNLFLSIRNIKKEKKKNKYQVPITSLSFHGAIYWHKPVYIFSHKAAHFFWTCKMCIYYLLLHLFPSLCHIL